MKVTVSFATLRDESVFEIGRAPGTSVLFVITEERVLLCHTQDVSARRLDSYGAGVVVAMLERGERIRDVAAGLGVANDDISAATRRLGYSSRPSSLRSGVL